MEPTCGSIPLFFLPWWVEAGSGANVGRYKGLLSLGAQEGIWKSVSGSISLIVLGALSSRPRRVSQGWGTPLEIVLCY